MLLPTQFSILTVEDAKIMIKYIEDTTKANAARKKEFREIGRTKELNELYERLRLFVYESGLSDWSLSVMD